MKKHMAPASAIAFLALTWQIPPASPMAVPCLAEPQFEDALLSRFGETLDKKGLAADGSFMHLYSNARTHTWSLGFSVGGIICLSAAGRQLKTEIQGTEL